MDIVMVVVCTSEVVKMKEYLLFCRELSTLCSEENVFVEHDV